MDKNTELAIAVGKLTFKNEVTGRLHNVIKECKTIQEINLMEKVLGIIKNTPTTEE